MKKSILFSLALTSLAAGLALVNAGCDTASANDVVRTTGLDFSGFYANENGRIIDRVSGSDVTSLNLIQTGDRLEAVDNNGRIFRGSLNETGASAAQFTMRGVTTDGVQGTLTGNLTGSGTTGTLRGTWIEPSLVASAFATATINPVSTNSNSNTGNLALSPSGTVNLTVNGTRTFTASGGSGTYTWAVSSTSLGTLSATTGASVTYTARATGTQTVTLSDGRNTPVTASVVQTTGTTIQ